MSIIWQRLRKDEIIVDVNWPKKGGGISARSRNGHMEAGLLNGTTIVTERICVKEAKDA